MRGQDEQQFDVFSYVSPEQRVPQDHPLRTLRVMTNEALRELQPRLCVQRRLACTAGDKPAGARVRSPVAWIAERRETKFLKPIDDRLRGRRASHRAVMKMNVNVASKVKKSEGRARNREGEGSMDS